MNQIQVFNTLEMLEDEEDTLGLPAQRTRMAIDLADVTLILERTTPLDMTSQEKGTVIRTVLEDISVFESFDEVLAVWEKYRSVWKPNNLNN